MCGPLSCDSITWIPSYLWTSSNMRYEVCVMLIAHLSEGFLYVAAENILAAIIIIMLVAETHNRTRF